MVSGGTWKDGVLSSSRGHPAVQAAVVRSVIPAAQPDCAASSRLAVPLCKGQRRRHLVDLWATAHYEKGEVFNFQSPPPAVNSQL